ncbi:MAG: spermidine synthase [Gemmatimonadales bacterium]|nr:spermidine synthase [Gemmatimonadales bacterium]
MIGALTLLFILSGAAGLMYESIWTRYLGLFVGHDAYAQIIVLVIFLGGMSAGAMLVSRRSTRIAEPLVGYVAVEFLVGCLGLFFHEAFNAVTGWAYTSVYPGITGTMTLAIAKWAIAGALILPQSILLGMTFPLMTAGILRLSSKRPGRTLSMLYFANSIGAAGGVLVAGFYLVEAVGLPGTLLAAAIVNLSVAALTVAVIVANRSRPAPAASAPSSPSQERVPDTIRRRLLATSFVTAVASFIYEIAWIRMLSLVLGSATHSFELMLSAFILGLALGALWIRSRADRLADPLRALGIVQWTMGALALATLPLYLHSFGWVASLIAAFAPTDAGYTGFTLARYALCLVVMLPATFCAGMTLPLITRTLLRHRAGEAAVGSVYAWNTLGSIVGVIVAGLVLLPTVGLHAMLIAGAMLDMAVGVFLLRQPAPSGVRPRPRLASAGALAAALVAVVAWGGLRFDPVLLSSGVYRTGAMVKPGEREIRFHRDGRTATVSGIIMPTLGLFSLVTNGKPDASLPRSWYLPCDSSAPREALGADAATQTLLPLVTLAHAPVARTAAIIGQGSGMSSHLLLASPALRSLVTIEIEPEMIRGSRLFYPANRRAFDDPRSHIVIDDAKSFFASAHQRYDLIMSEPSNPWVSGVSGLFTVEFYQRVSGYLSDTGVFGQWLHVYELDDGLVLSVLAAIHRTFPSYEIYLVPSGDLLVVASNRPSLPRPDWSVMELPALHTDLCHYAPLTPAALDGLHLAGRAELGPLLADGVQPNSDFYPILDLGAERRRFRHDFAAGFPALSADWFSLVSSVRQRRLSAGVELVPAIPENPRVRARALGALLRTPAALTATALPPSVAAGQAIWRWRQWHTMEAQPAAPANWELWLEQAGEVDRLRNAGTAGVADEAFYAALEQTVARHDAPAAVRDVIAFRHGLAAWNFGEAARAADRLTPVAMREHRWITADELRDGAVFARLHTGDISGARRDLNALAPFSVRKSGDLRSRLLEAYVRTFEARRAVAAR